MGRFLEPCVDCGTLSHSSRCPTHTAAYGVKRNARNPSRTQKKAILYNSQYRKEAKLIRDNATHCHLCQRPFVTGDSIEADHLNPSDPNSPLAPAHRLCNQRRGNKPLN